jgi:hypothetical protein
MENVLRDWWKKVRERFWAAKLSTAAANYAHCLHRVFIAAY